MITEIGTIELTHEQYSSLIKEIQRLREEVARLREICSGKITNKMKVDCMGEFWIDDIYTDANGIDRHLKTTVDWVTMKEIYKAMLKSAMEELEQQND